MENPDDTKQNLNWLHERTQQTKSDVSTHEAVCAERYNNLMNTITKLEEALASNTKQIAELHKIASEGKTSFKTVLFIGGLVTGITTIIYTLLGIINNS